MSWDFFLLPRPAEARFSEELVSSMHAYWQVRPTYRRSDGFYVLVDSMEERDRIVASGFVDEMVYDRQLVRVEPEKITFGVMLGLEEQSRQLYEFMKWVQERVECVLLDESYSEVDLEWWLAATTGASERDSRS